VSALQRYRDACAERARLRAVESKAMDRASAQRAIVDRLERAEHEAWDRHQEMVVKEIGGEASPEDLAAALLAAQEAEGATEKARAALAPIERAVADTRQRIAHHENGPLTVATSNVCTEADAVLRPQLWKAARAYFTAAAYRQRVLASLGLTGMGAALLGDGDDSLRQLARECDLSLEHYWQRRHALTPQEAMRELEQLLGTDESETPDAA
jgi:hypothetical protein